MKATSTVSTLPLRIIVDMMGIPRSQEQFIFDRTNVILGLTDEEYRWEPVPGAWNVRPRGTGTAPIAVGGGEFTMDYAMPEPDPPPVTTIAWRLGHIVVGVLGMRVASHFGGPPDDYATHRYPGDAATALAQLDAAYAGWIGGVRGLAPSEMARAIGPGSQSGQRRERGVRR